MRGLKKQLSIWMQGGIGGGNFSQGYPAMLLFVNLLAEDSDVTVYSILPANPDFKPAGFIFRTVNPKIRSVKLRTLLLFFVFLFDHARKPFDVIHGFWGYPAGTLAVILGKIVRRPTMVTIQGGEAAAVASIAYGNMLNPLLKKVTLWTCEQATSLTFISEFLHRSMLGFGLQRLNCVVIPFGVTGDRFKYFNKVRNAQIHIIHVSNLTAVKDQVTLLRSFAKIRARHPSTLRILGDGECLEPLQQLSNELGIADDIEFLGMIRHKDLQSHYNWADFMLHTSLHEGQSGVGVEAMASGVVVVSTRVGIMADLDGDCCFTTNVGDAEALAEGLLSLWNDRARYEQLRDNALKWSDEHTLQWTVSRFCEAYEAMTHG